MKLVSDGTVNCPVCGQEMTMREINAHLDEHCCGSMPKRLKTTPGVGNTQDVGALLDEGPLGPSLGRRVRLTGFSSNMHLNGKFGTVVDFDARSDRWKVRLDADGQEGLTNVKNLIMIPASGINAVAIESARHADDKSEGNDTLVPVAAGSCGPGSAIECQEPPAAQPDLELPVDVETRDEATEAVWSHQGPDRGPARKAPTEPVRVLAAQGSGCKESLEPRVRGVLALLLDERLETLRASAAVIASSKAEVGRLADVAKAALDSCRGDLEAYPGLPPPATYEDLQNRNRTRHRLLEAAQTVHDSVSGALIQASRPSGDMERAEGTVLGHIDQTIARLRDLRAETEQAFKAQHEKASEACDANKAAVAALVPDVTALDAFVALRAMQEDEENREARANHERTLEQLRRQETQFVRANDSPGRNPAFKEVRSNIETTTALLEDLDKGEASRKAFSIEWGSMLDKLFEPPFVPTCPTPEPAPGALLQGPAPESGEQRPMKRKRSLWGLWRQGA